MEETFTVFLPPRREGIILHTAAAAVLLLAGAGVLAYALTAAHGSLFYVSVALALVLLMGLLPLFAYRGYALWRAGYTLQRDGLRISWGLRIQDIPLPDIEWVRPAEEMGFSLPLPWLRWPGAVLGVRQVPELGPVEFMASTTATMLLLATPERVYAISPEDPRAFIRAFQRAMEYGSLTPLPAFSARPGAFIRQALSDRRARIPLLVGLGLTVLLFVLAAVRVSSGGQVSLGYDPSGQLLPPAPAERVMLLPVLSALSIVSSTLLGLFFYRRPEQQHLSYLLWLASPLAPALLLFSLLFVG